MTATLDSLSPYYIGADKIAVSLDQSSILRTFQPITLNFDYSQTGINGIILPIEVVVQPAFYPGGPAAGFKSKLFKKSRPESFTFTPPSAGQYLVLIRELFHNKWQGRIVLNISGDNISDIYTERAR
jgi:hypothetical protein